MYGADSFAAREVKEHLDDQLQEQRRVLPTGEANNPGMFVLGAILFAHLGERASILLGDRFDRLLYRGLHLVRHYHEPAPLGTHSGAGPAREGGGLGRKTALNTIYLDNNATTRVDPAVLEAMLPYLQDSYGNASSASHDLGRAAAQAVEHARDAVAKLAGATRREVVFTSGATESNNLAILGTARALEHRGRHVITQVTEHPSVLAPFEELKRQGWLVTFLPVDSSGLVAKESVEKAIRPETTLVSIMWANNEIGAIQDVAGISIACKRRGVVFHCDASQAASSIRIDTGAEQVDLLSLSAHKFYGPKGVGALVVRKSNSITPLVFGGRQERGLRSGTIPVHQVVGMGVACELVSRAISEGEPERIRSLRDLFVTELQRELTDLQINGGVNQRLPGNANLWVPNCEAEALLMSATDVAFSSGSACTSTSIEPSYVLIAIGCEESRAFESIRVSIGRFNTRDEILIGAARVSAAARSLRAIGAAR